MRSRVTLLLALTVLSATVASGQRGTLTTTVPTTVATGTLRDGTSYTMAKPENWNGTLFVSLDSGGLNSAYANWLYTRGYAMAGNDRTKVGSLMNQATANLVETVDLFGARFGQPKRSIVWGVSLGGQAVAVAAYRYPDRFAAALSHCGGLMGWPAYLNTNLDVAFTLKTLLAPPGANLPLVHIPEDDAELTKTWTALIEDAQRTPQGRARIALAAALGQAPVWTTRNTPEPAADDPVARQEAWYRTVLEFSRQFTGLRRRLEAPAGGATSWNTGVDYAALLAGGDATNRRTVEALYRDAGLSLTGDLQALEKAPRVAPEKAPTDFVWNMYPFDGAIRIPMLTMAATGDPVVWTTIDSGYEARVRQAGRQDLLRMTYVHSTGHCGFNDAERIASFQVLLERLDTGRWPETSHDAMNQRAMGTGIDAGRFSNFRPARLYRAAQRP